MKEFIEKLISRLEEVSYNHFDLKLSDAKEIVNHLAKEYKGEELSKSQKIYNFIKREINPYGKPFEGTVYEFGLKVMNYITNLHTEEYNNDVCEWEKGSSGYVGYPAYYSRCCTTNSKGLEMQTHIISDWKFCPYCGKKIKVSPYQPKGE